MDHLFSGWSENEWEFNERGSRSDPGHVGDLLQSKHISWWQCHQPDNQPQAGHNQPL